VAISLADLVAIYSSRDDALYARMLAPTNRYAARLLEREERRDGLLDLLKGGHIQNASAPHHTAYAFEAIAFELGTPIGEIDSRDCDRVHELLAASGVRFELFPDVTEKWPVPIADTPDMPLFGVLLPQQIAERHAVLAQLGRSDEPYTDDEIALDAAQQIFDAALAAGTDAVVFFH
jgi:hypothetical protein